MEFPWRAAAARFEGDIEGMAGMQPPGGGEDTFYSGWVVAKSRDVVSW